MYAMAKQAHHRTPVNTITRVKKMENTAMSHRPSPAAEDEQWRSLREG